jgi:hypothetical protein
MAVRIKRRHYRLIERGAQRVLDFAHRYTYPARGRRFPPLLINTLPKSGSVFLLRNLEQILEVDSIRIKWGGLTKASVADRALEKLAFGNRICQEHLPAHDHILAALELKVPRLVLHLRDPRQALVSWTHHINRAHEIGLHVSTFHGVEGRLPAGYFDQPIGDQLAWQVENVLPTSCKWISDWLDVVEKPGELSILVTTFDELAADGRKILERILDFYEIDYDPQWIKVAPPVPGKRHYRTGGADWRSTYTPELLERATAMVSERERERFGWN